MLVISKNPSTSLIYYQGFILLFKGNILFQGKGYFCLSGPCTPAVQHLVLLIIIYFDFDFQTVIYI